MIRLSATALIRFLPPLTLLTLLAACSATPESPPRALPPTAACPVCPATPDTPPEAEAPPPEPLQKVSWSALEGWEDDNHDQAWPALLQSCSTLVHRPQWKPVCTAAQQLGANPARSTARRFFEDNFTPWAAVRSDGATEGLVTGYFEPLITGSRERSDRYRWPVHGVPEDMLTVELGDVYPDLKHLRLRGRVVGDRVVPYWTRAELDTLDEQVAAPVLFWAEDAIDLFFLQVQGSGQIQLPDGERARIGYADQNGHPYNSIGRWLVSNGELALEQASMQGIKKWARDNPARLAEMLHANPSYVFFRELPPSQGGPVGALGVPLSAQRSIALDPRFAPLGAPVFLATTYPNTTQPLRRLVLAQDTGGAIKGAARADFFWGFGDEAGARAGAMKQAGRMWVLLPRGMTP